MFTNKNCTQQSFDNLNINALRKLDTEIQYQLIAMYYNMNFRTNLEQLFTFKVMNIGQFCLTVCSYDQFDWNRNCSLLMVTFLK